jgi:O-antigen ligase
VIGTTLTVLATVAGFFLFYIGYKAQDNNYFLYHYGTLPPGNYPRLQAFFVNANMMCNYLNISLVLTVLAEKLNWLKITWTRALHFGICFAAFFAFSPGLGGLFLSFGVWLWANFYFEGRKSFAKCALYTGFFLALIFFAVTSISPDTANTTQDFNVPFFEQKFEPSVRVLIWQDSLETIRQYPLFGKGTGSGVASVEYTVISGENQFLTDAHNIWLNILGQFGLFGLVAFVNLCAYLFWKCKFNLTDNSKRSFVQLSLSCAFLGAFCFQGLQGSFENARHLWVLFGLLASFGTESFDEKVA